MPQHSKNSKGTKKATQSTQKEAATTNATGLKRPLRAIKNRTDAYLARRPHRSFRRTRRRDYKRSLELPGYIAFTRSVNRTLWGHKKMFIWLAIVYAILTSILVGIGSQTTYSTLTSTLQTTGNDIFQGNLGQLGQAALLLASIGTSGISGTPTAQQQIYLVLITLLIWLTTVWLLRNVLAGHKVKMRDGIYNAGAPIIGTAIIAAVFIFQLIPLGIAIFGYTAANSAGLLAGGVSAMLFWIAAALLVVMSLYWVTSTFFAMIIVTLPGMYPFQALKTAGDMMVGRRVRVLLRILWMLFMVVLFAAVILIPAIILDTWLVKLWSFANNIPVIPVLLMLVGVVVFIWVASYIYLLYRKVIDDDAKPA